MGVPPFSPGTEDPGYLYLKFADYLAACIRAQKLKPGSRLPGERDFAAEHGVSIGTVRRATEVLRERGLVVTLPAKGTFVAPGELLEELTAPPPAPGETTTEAPGETTAGETTTGERQGG